MRPELRDIRVAGFDGRSAAPVCAIVFGTFAVHETVDPIDPERPEHRWAVTRISCGRKFPRHFTKDDAIELAVVAHREVGRLPWHRAEPVLKRLWLEYKDRAAWPYYEIDAAGVADEGY